MAAETLTFIMNLTMELYLMRVSCTCLILDPLNEVGIYPDTGPADWYVPSRCTLRFEFSSTFPYITHVNTEFGDKNFSALVSHPL